MKFGIIGALCLCIIGLSNVECVEDSQILAIFSKFVMNPMKFEADQCDSNPASDLTVCTKQFLNLASINTETEAIPILKAVGPVVENDESKRSLLCSIYSSILTCFKEEIKGCGVSNEIVQNNAQNENKMYYYVLLLGKKCNVSQEDDNEHEDNGATDYFEHLNEEMKKRMKLIDTQKWESEKLRVREILKGLADANIPSASVDQQNCQRDAPDVVKPCFTFAEQFLKANDENVNIELRLRVLPEVIREDLMAENSVLSKDHLNKLCQLFSEIKKCLLQASEKCTEYPKVDIFVKFTLDLQLALSEHLCGDNGLSFSDLSTFKQLAAVILARLKDLTLPESPPLPDHSKCGETDPHPIVAPCLLFVKEQLAATSDDDLEARKKLLHFVFMSSMDKRKCGQVDTNMGKICRLVTMTQKCLQIAEEKCTQHTTLTNFIKELIKGDKLKQINKHCMKNAEGDKVREFLKSVQIPEQNDQSVLADTCADGGEKAFGPCKNFLVTLLQTNDKEFDNKLMSISKEVAQVVLKGDAAKATETMNKVCKLGKLSIKCYEDGIKTCAAVEKTRKFGENSIKMNLSLRRILSLCNKDTEGVINIEKLREIITKVKELEEQLTVPKEVSLPDNICSSGEGKYFQTCVNLLQTTLQGTDETDSEMRALAITILLSTRLEDDKCRENSMKLKDKICGLVKLSDTCVEKVKSTCEGVNPPAEEFPVLKYIREACKEGDEDDNDNQFKTLISPEQYYKQLKDELYMKMQSYSEDQMTSAMIRVKALLSGLKDQTFADIEISPSNCNNQPHEALRSCFSPVLTFLRSSDENVDDDLRLFALPMIMNQEILDESSTLEIVHLQKYCRIYSVTKNCLSLGKSVCKNNPLVPTFVDFTMEHRPSMKFGALMCGDSGPIITDLSSFRQLSTVVNELLINLTVPESGPSPDLTQCSQSEAANIVAPCVLFMKNLVQASTDEDAKLKKFALSQIVMRTMQQRTCGGTASNVDKLCRLLGMITKCFDNAITGCKDHATLPSLIENLKRTDKITRVIGPKCMKRWTEDKEMESLNKLQVPNNDYQPVTNCQEGGEKAFAPCLNFAKVILNIDSEFEEKLEAVSKQVEHLVFEGEIGLATPLVVKVCKLTKLVTKCYQEGITTCSNVDAVRQFGEESLKSNKVLNRILQYCNPDGNGAINLNKLREVMVDVKSKEDQLKVPDQVTITEEGCNADKVYQPCTNMLQTFLQVESNENVELRSLAVQRLLFVFMGDNKCDAKVKSLKGRICELSKKFQFCLNSGMAVCSEKFEVVQKGKSILQENKVLHHMKKLCEAKKADLSVNSELIETLKKHLKTLKMNDIKPANVEDCDVSDENLFNPCFEFLKNALDASDENDLIQRSYAFLKILDAVRSNQERGIKLKILENILKRTVQCFKVGMAKCKSKTNALALAQDKLLNNPLLNRALELEEVDEKKKRWAKEAEEAKKKQKELEKERKEKEKEFMKQVKDARGNGNKNMKEVWNVVIQFTLQKVKEKKEAIQKEVELAKELRKIISEDIRAILINLIVPDLTPQISSCNDADASKVFEPCFDFFVTIFNGKSDDLDTRMNVFVREITERLGEQDNNFLTNQMPIVCKIIDLGLNCFNGGISQCSSKTDIANYGKSFISKWNLWRLGEKFCSGNQIAASKIQLVKTSNKQECSNMGAGRKAVQKIAELTKKLILVQAYITQEMVNQYLQEDGSLSKGDVKTLKKVCLLVRSLISEVQIELSKKGNPCNDAAKIMMVEEFNSQIIPGIGQVCTLPDPVKDGVGKKGKPKDTVRKTLVFMGLCHIKSALRAGTNLFETCVVIDEDIINLIVHFTFRISAVRENSKFQGSPFLKSVSVHFVDADENEITLTLDSDLEDFAEQFSQITDKFPDVKIKKEGKHNLKIEDTARGLYLIIRKLIVNGDTPVFYVVFRGPASVIDESSGYLITGCLDNQNIGESEEEQQRRRRKREASADESGQYDADVSGDSKMKDEAQDTEEDAAASAQSDKKYFPEDENKFDYRDQLGSDQTTLKLSFWILLAPILMMAFLM